MEERERRCESLRSQMTRQTVTTVRRLHGECARLKRAIIDPSAVIRGSTANPRVHQPFNKPRRELRNSVYVSNTPQRGDVVLTCPRSCDGRWKARQQRQFREEGRVDAPAPTSEGGERACAVIIIIIILCSGSCATTRGS